MKKSDLEARREAALRALAEAEKELAKREVMGVDEWEDGTVLCIGKRFRENGIVYEYIAFKATSCRWYMTGAGGYRNSYTWETMVDDLVGQGEIVSVWRVTGWERVL